GLARLCAVRRLHVATGPRVGRDPVETSGAQLTFAASSPDALPIPNPPHCCPATPSFPPAPAGQTVLARSRAFSQVTTSPDSKAGA
ncbi:MAG: hypothetical protein OSB10_11315, partial [Planctomycetota bacterium]|nr:hypothetical protein [Planctomycetota bacterium]